MILAGYRVGESSLAPFFTSDGGASWQAHARPGGQFVPVLAGTPTIAFLKDIGFILRSTDTGRSWAPVSLPLPPVNEVVQLWGVNPANANELVASAGYAVFHSIDGGTTWTPDAAPAQVSAIDVDWSTRTIYASFRTNSSLGHRPVDTPGAWGVGGQNPLRFAAAHGVVIYTSGTVIFRSIDGGNVFSPAAQPFGPANICEFTFSAAPATRVYAAECDGGRIFRSNDDGASWTVATTLPSTYVGSLAVDAGNPDLVYVVWLHGVLLSTDGATSFAPLVRSTGAPGDSRLLFFDATTPSRQWLSRDKYQSTSILRSIDDGATWTVVSEDHRLLGSSRTRANTLFGVYATEREFRLSTDGGSTWSAKFAVSQQSVKLGPLVYGQGIGEIFVAAFGGSATSTTRSVYYSNDDGESFSERFSPPVSVYAMAATPSGPPLLYAGGSALSAGAPQLYRSTNGAVTWQPVAAFPAPSSPFGGTVGNTLTALAVDPSNPNRIYGGFSSPDYVMRSDDAGATWIRATSGLGAGMVTALVIDPANSSTIYATQYGSGIFRSTDRGATWTAMDDGLHDEVVLGVKLDPQTEGRLYAETGSGIYRTDLGTGVPPGNRRAIEFYYAAFDHYFVSADLDEIAGLDAGVFSGWARTGEGFRVAEATTPGNLPVCRFFSIGFQPLATHFYTPYANECDILKTDPNWVYEKIAFGLATPDPATRGCPPSSRQLFRLWNKNMGGTPNHRYTTGRATLDDMVYDGWVFEGNADTEVFACVPY